MATRPSSPTGAGSSESAASTVHDQPGRGTPIEPGRTSSRRESCHGLMMNMPCSVCPYWSRTSTPNCSRDHSITSGVSGSPAAEARRSLTSAGAMSRLARMVRYTVGAAAKLVTR